MNNRFDENFNLQDKCDKYDFGTPGNRPSVQEILKASVTYPLGTSQPQSVTDAEFIHFERLRERLEGDFVDAFPVTTLKMP